MSGHDRTVTHAGHDHDHDHDHGTVGTATRIRTAG